MFTPHAGERLYFVMLAMSLVHSICTKLFGVRLAHNEAFWRADCGAKKHVWRRWDSGVRVRCGAAAQPFHAFRAVAVAPRPFTAFSRRPSLSFPAPGARIIVAAVVPALVRARRAAKDRSRRRAELLGPACAKALCVAGAWMHSRRACTLAKAQPHRFVARCC